MIALGASVLRHQQRRVEGHRGEPAVSPAAAAPGSHAAR